MTSAREMTTLSEVLADRDTLVLSPHMDDAMLSASSVVLDHPCEVWTVFTAAPVPPQTTSWDTSCGFPDSDATIAARKLEDAAAFEAIPARTRHLDHLEGAYATREQHRAALPQIEAEIDAWMEAHPNGVVITPACAGLHMPPPVWQPVLSFARAARSALPKHRVSPEANSAANTDAEAMPSSTTPPLSTDADALISTATDGGMHPAEHHTLETPSPSVSPRGETALPGRVAAAGAGTAKKLVQRALHAEHLWRRRRTMGEDGLAANPDHLALRDLTLRAASRHPGVRIAMFEDLPYLWHARGADEVARLERRLGLTTLRLSEQVDVERKHRHLSAYASQLPVLDGSGRLMEAEHLPKSEIFWLID